jgi:hypothetical protein
VYPDTLYAAGRGSFLRPVAQPITNPSDTPTVSVAINCDWLPYVRGALQQLLLQATWIEGFPGLDITQGRVFDLIDLFQECSAPVAPFVCVDDFTRSGTGLPWTMVGRGDLTAPTAVFVPTIGWSAVSSFEAGGADFWMCVSIHLMLASAAEIGIVQCGLAGVAKGSNYAGDLAANNSGILIYNAGVYVTSHLAVANTIPDGDSIFSYDFGGAVGDEVQLTFLFAVTQFGPADGQGFIAGAIVTGHAYPDPCP